MLENVDLSKKLGKAAYRQALPQLQAQLHRLQRACWEQGLGSLVVIEGWEGAGKAAAITKLTERLEPRGFAIHSARAARTQEQLMPWLWRFWRRLPAYGQMAIFNRSWYRRVLVERVEQQVPEAQWRQAYRHIVNFERALADDRYVLVKLFLHLDRREQKKRLKALERDPGTSWRLEQEDWEQNRKYDAYLQASEEMLEQTETEWGPWTILAATDQRWTRAQVFTTLRDRLADGLRRHGLPLPEYDQPVAHHRGEADDEALLPEH